ncbi:hypothetical protein [Kitasatospora sp. NPDC050543]
MEELGSLVLPAPTKREQVAALVSTAHAEFGEPGGAFGGDGGAA